MPPKDLDDGNTDLAWFFGAALRIPSRIRINNTFGGRSSTLASTRTRHSGQRSSRWVLTISSRHFLQKVCWHGNTLLDVSSRSKHTEHSNKSFSIHSSIMKRSFGFRFFHTTQSVVPSVVSTPDSSSLRLHSLYRNALPPSFNPPNCSLSLSLSFLSFHRSSSPVRFSRAAAIRRRAERNGRFIGLQFRHRTLPPSVGIQFAFTRPSALLCLLLLFSFSLPRSYPPFALARGKVRDRPVPRNTHARLFARSIDGLINDVSAVARRRHGLGAHRGHGIDQSRASSIRFAAGSCTCDTAVIVRADGDVTATLPDR